MSAERVKWLRDHGSRLARMSKDLFEQASILEREMSERPIIKGKELADVAAVVLLFQGEGGMHYRDLMVLVEDRSGKRVRGIDPAATFLTTIHRDPRFVSCGSRSGRWMLAPESESS